MARGKFRPHITTWDLFDLEETAGDPFFYDSLILAEGDSWFTIGGLFAPNLLMSMRFHKDTLILNCASPGDTIVHMSALAHNYVYKEALRYNYAWDAILLSGGGNDLIDRADEIILDKAQRQGLSPSTARPTTATRKSSTGWSTISSWATAHWSRSGTMPPARPATPRYSCTPTTTRPLATHRRSSSSRPSAPG